jgi:hypothetical protein
MVFWHKGNSSATGVASARAALVKNLFNGEYLINAQGETWRRESAPLMKTP